MVDLSRISQVLLTMGVLCVSTTSVNARSLVENGNDNLDCQVSPWSSWEACDPLTNKKTRFRRVEVAPTGHGTACPVLVDEAECHYSLALEATSADGVPTVLSTPLASDRVGPRANAIAQVAAQIANIPRTLLVGGENYPIFPGPPLYVPGSLRQQIDFAEIVRLRQFGTTQPQQMGGLAFVSLPTLTSMDAINNLYSQATSILDLPMSTDPSDEAFGLQRLTYKSFVLRAVRRDEFNDTPFTITTAQTIQRCGATLARVRAAHNLYVEDFSTIAQWNDPQHPEKYVPNSISFYCWHPQLHKLLPIEIRLLAMQLAYTPFDATNDWTLAKMAVDSATISYQNVIHMVSTHGTTIPVRVEVMRHMAEVHPVRVLFQRHEMNEFALELISTQVLFNTSTAVDKTFGWGATGCLRFMYAMVEQQLSLRTFKQDIAARGLRRLGAHHKYVYYASKYWDIMSAFVDRYLCLYYPNNRAIRNDFELQNWAQGVSVLPQLKHFPSQITTRDQLRQLLTHLIFTSSITHHGMNGQGSWMSMSAPYSTPALWKPLPTAKTTNEAPLNLLEYTLPLPLLPTYVGLIAMFSRAVPRSESFIEVYSVAPFTNEVGLQPAILAFKRGLQEIESTIVANEQGETWPYTVLRPSMLSFGPWV